MSIEVSMETDGESPGTVVISETDGCGLVSRDVAATSEGAGADEATSFEDSMTVVFTEVYSADTLLVSLVVGEDWSTSDGGAG